jgi:hypothetical protein
LKSFVCVEAPLQLRLPVALSPTGPAGPAPSRARLSPRPMQSAPPSPGGDAELAGADDRGGAGAGDGSGSGAASASAGASALAAAAAAAAVEAEAAADRRPQALPLTAAADGPGGGAAGVDASSQATILLKKRREARLLDDAVAQARARFARRSAALDLRAAACDARRAELENMLVTLKPAIEVRRGAAL